MPTKYCPHPGCGARFESSYEQPAKFCPKCGKSLTTPFASPVIPTVATPYSQSEPAPARAHKVFRNAKGEDISHLYNAPAPVRPERSGGNDEGDYVDKDEVSRLASELAASISTADFSVTLETKDETTKLGSILGPVLQAQNSKQSKGKKSRKS
jgi:hypothetical protein